MYNCIMISELLEKKIHESNLSFLSSYTYIHFEDEVFKIEVFHI